MQTILLKYLIQHLEIALTYHEILNDDPENLHQFRLELRRIRSLLKLYMPDAYAFSEVLKEVFKPTNRLRDLDVLLQTIDKERYLKLYKYIYKQRKIYYKTVLSSSTLDKQKHSLERLHTEFIYYYSSEPIVSLHDKAYRLYLQTTQNYNRTAQNASLDQLHQLRIDMKEARYALEFLHNEGLFYLEKEIRTCKKILNKLGEIQDGRNQIKLLKALCKEYKGEECKTLLQERKGVLITLKQSLKK